MNDETECRMNGETNHPQILIAGVGNIFLGDDAFGVEVAQRLARRSQPSGVRVVDFGIRGIDLMYSLLDGYESVILVDAAPRGKQPGTLYVIEPDTDAAAPPEQAELLIDMHAMEPARVLRAARSIGGSVQRVLLVGCEPKPVDYGQEMAEGLSEPVGEAVDAAVELVESLVARLLSRRAAAEQHGGVGVECSWKGSGGTEV